jgi:hypothetical protein
VTPETLRLSSEKQLESYRTFLAERRQKLRVLYHSFRGYGSAMQQKGLVKWSGEKRGYVSEVCYIGSGFGAKERALVKSLLQLEKNITQQALLLLEMEHSIDCEEVKRNERGQAESVRQETDRGGAGHV